MNFKLFNDLIFVTLEDIMNEALLHKNIHDSEVAIKAVFLLMEVVEVREDGPQRQWPVWQGIITVYRNEWNAFFYRGHIGGQDL